MAKQEIRRKANIGSSSLILIFIVLCLVTFSVLSLGNAKREDALSRRSADSVQEYYRADAAGEAFLQLADQALLKGDKDSLMPYLQSASGTYECRSGAPGRAGAGLGTENVSGAFLEGISPGRL